MERFNKITGVIIIFIVFLYILLPVFEGEQSLRAAAPLLGVNLACAFLLILNSFLSKLLFRGRKMLFLNIYISLICISLLIFSFGLTSDLFFIYFFFIIEMAISHGRKNSWRVALITILFYLAIVLLKIILEQGLYNYDLLAIIGMRVVLLIISGYQCDALAKEDEQLQIKQQDLLIELQKTYNELAGAHEQLQEKVQLLEINNQKLESSYTEFYTLQQISKVISSILDINDLLRQINDMVIGIMGVKLCIILLWDDEKKELVIRNSNLPDNSQWKKLTFKIGDDLPGKVLEIGEPVIYNEVGDRSKIGKDLGLESMLGVPLRVVNENLGVILVGHQMPNAFNSDNLRLLSIITGQISVAIENANLYKRMQELATIDGLTKAYNRLFFQDRYLEEFSIVQSEKKRSLALIMFDVDHFKKFNDNFGHLLGDKVLQKVAATVKEKLRERDLLARYGGEEFIILLPNTTSKQAFNIAERLRKLIADLEIVDYHVTAGVTVSIGVAAYPENASNERELLKAVDDALYQAKAQGRNCVCLAPSKVDSK